MTLTEVRQLLAELDIRPSKALGQNFLIDGNILRILIEQADLRPDESVLEIGPGLGVLTVELVARARRVVAIEKDPRLCQYLRDHLDGVELIEGDAVDVLEQPSFRSTRRTRSSRTFRTTSRRRFWNGWSSARTNRARWF